MEIHDWLWNLSMWKQEETFCQQRKTFTWYCFWHTSKNEIPDNVSLNQNFRLMCKWSTMKWMRKLLKQTLPLKHPTWSNVFANCYYKELMPFTNKWALWNEWQLCRQDPHLKNKAVTRRPIILATKWQL